MRLQPHTEHLNTPRLIADDQQRTVWRWDNTDPFGGNPPDENPSGLGTFEFPLRLPGQYYDKETNLHYNYFRDYDPSLGRYVQSDPIGLLGGLNTYSYVAARPLTLVDPTGEVPMGAISILKNNRSAINLYGQVGLGGGFQVLVARLNTSCGGAFSFGGELCQ